VKVYSEQIAHLDQARDTAFRVQIRADIRKAHAADAARFDDDALDAVIAVGVARAKGFGLQRKATIALFVEMMFILAPGFHDYPPIRAMLQRSPLPPDARLDAAIDAMTDADWRAAAMRDDPAWWTGAPDRRAEGGG
jgi:hypothetical protein